MQINEIITESKKSLLEKQQLSESKKIIEETLQNDLAEFHKEIILGLNLLEEIEVVPSSIVGADGRPMRFRVIDTDTGDTLGSFTDEDEARRVRNQERSARAPAPSRDTDDPNRNRPQDNDQSDNNANRNRPQDNDQSNNDRTQRRETMRQAFRRRFGQPFNLMGFFRRKSVLYNLASTLGVALSIEAMDLDGRLARSLGIDTDEGMTTNHQDLLESYWRMAQVGRLVRSDTDIEDMSQEEAREHIRKNIEMYEQILARSYAIVVAAFLPEMWRMLRSGSSAILKFIRWLRRARNIATGIAAGVGAAFGAGVGGIVTGLFTYILGSAALWVAQLVLQRSGIADTVIEYVLQFLYDRDRGEFAENIGVGLDTLDSWGVGDTIAGIGANTAEIIGADELAQNLRNVERDLMNDPRGRAEAERLGNILSVDNPEFNQSQGQGASPQSQSVPSQSPSPSAIDMGLVPN